MRWAPIAYGVFLIAALAIFATTYTTYAFSKYRGVILPGVYIAHVYVGEKTPTQARNTIYTRLAAIAGVPITLTYGSRHWSPTKADIDLQYDVGGTVRDAELVGRHESFPEQLLDRLPVHPEHNVPLLYRPDEKRLRLYIRSAIAAAIRRPSQNANLRMNLTTDHVDLIRSHPGVALDIPGTDALIHSVLGDLLKQTRPVPVRHIAPVVTDAYARGIQAQVERFLARPPVIAVGKRIIPTTRAEIAPMLSFPPYPTVQGNKASIKLYVNSDVVAQYVAALAQHVDRSAQNPRLSFAGAHVRVLQPRRTGRTLDEAGAQAALLRVLTSLRPHAHLRFKVATVQPTVDPTNPASLGINTLLGTGVTSFEGAPVGRLTEIQAIASRFNDVLLPPTGDISFNQLAGTNWPATDYTDREREVAGSLVPSGDGAVQQVATTFLRALYAAGLTVEERHSHTYRLPWYEPPFPGPLGLDAVVSSDGTEDLRFANVTDRYLLLETRVEPIRQELYMYVYGPRLNWEVRVDENGKIIKTYRHPPAIVTQDPSLPPGQRRQTAWAHDGADVVVKRTITKPKGGTTTDTIATHYQPWRAVIAVGPAATPTPTPTKTPKASKGTATPVLTGTPGTPVPPGTPKPSPTPTFSH